MADFVSGKNVTLKYYLNNQPFVLFVKSWSVEEVAVEAEDGVNGEQRDRLQKITKFYKYTLEVFDDGSSNILQNLIASQANDDAFNPQLPLAGGLLFNYQNSTRAAFILNGCSQGPLKVASSGRTDRVMHNLSGRCQYFVQGPSM